MSNIDKQAVQAVADLKAGYTLGHADVEIIQQMALDAVTLLDELEAAEKRNADLEGLLEAEVRLWTQRYDCANSRREVAEKRIAELEASHGNLREAVAGIHNTITGRGAHTPLAAILNASKRAYEESAAAADKGEA